jgi:hypothetical protein
MSTTNKLGDPCPLVVYPSSLGQGNPCLLVTVYNNFLHNFFEQVEPPAQAMKIHPSRYVLHNKSLSVSGIFVEL